MESLEREREKERKKNPTIEYVLFESFFFIYNKELCKAIDDFNLLLYKNLIL